jgi:hypothetical protein
MNLRKKVKEHGLAIIIFIITLVVGIQISGDYGIAWDEPLQREIGLHTYDYVFSGDKSLNDYKNRDYGTAFELPLVILEKQLKLTDTRDIYRMRHLVCHLFFLLSALAFYSLIWILFRNKTYSVTGYLMLLLSPRIYAQSFYNSKDIPFLCMFILCFLFLALFFRDRKTWQLILLAILSGLTVSIRIMGIIIPLTVLAVMTLDAVTSTEQRPKLNKGIVYILIMVGVAILSWPWLWDDPAGRVKIAFQNMSKFRWDNAVLVNGNFVKASALDWKYLPQWFCYTTPVIYLFFGFTGILALIRNFLKKPMMFICDPLKRNFLVYLCCFLGPVAAVIFLHSVLYDGWRHLYFIYPAFVILAVYGLHSVLSIRWVHDDLLLVVFCTLLLGGAFIATGRQMYRSHPFEDVYFNKLLSRDHNYLRRTYELDYWGLSYRRAFEQILKRDHSPQVTVRVANLAGEHNLYILKPEERSRIKLVDSDSEARYFITNYRWHPQEYSFPGMIKIDSFVVLNSEISSVWKLKGKP